MSMSDNRELIYELRFAHEMIQQLARALAEANGAEMPRKGQTVSAINASGFRIDLRHSERAAVLAAATGGRHV